jgi:hypothetical protein
MFGKDEEKERSEKKRRKKGAKRKGERKERKEKEKERSEKKRRRDHKGMNTFGVPPCSGGAKGTDHSAHIVCLILGSLNFVSSVYHNPDN